VPGVMNYGFGQVAPLANDEVGVNAKAGENHGGDKRAGALPAPFQERFRSGRA